METLRSELFRGDARLEKALNSDPGHIVPGDRGEHVRKIQLALIQLDGAPIQADGQYGPATAAAVLAYKRKRSIINPSYQTQADNIVGRMTMAALDREMLALGPGSNACLVSDLFRGDARLEMTLRSDSHHVVPGDRGEFVSKIQYAVLVLEGGRINGGELQSRLYGPETAKVVHAYKSRRRIVNTAYQQAADNIVGKMTIRSLDSEMAVYESKERIFSSR